MQKERKMKEFVNSILQLIFKNYKVGLISS